jgi:hypothetical protein
VLTSTWFRWEWDDRLAVETTEHDPNQQIKGYQEFKTKTNSWEHFSVYVLSRDHLGVSHVKLPIDVLQGRTQIEDHEVQSLQNKHMPGYVIDYYISYSTMDFFLTRHRTWSFPECICAMACQEKVHSTNDFLLEKYKLIILRGSTCHTDYRTQLEAKENRVPQTYSIEGSSVRLPEVLPMWVSLWYHCLHFQMR